MEITLVPIAGTRVLVPFRMTHPDAVRTGDAGSDVVRDDGDAAAGGEDAVEWVPYLPSPLGEGGADEGRAG